MLLCHGIGLGYYAGIQPIMKWRFFSWHPFLLTLGMIAIPGIGAVMKKWVVGMGGGGVVCLFVCCWFGVLSVCVYTRVLYYYTHTTFSCCCC